MIFQAAPPDLQKCAYFQVTTRRLYHSGGEIKMILITGASGTVGRTRLAEVSRGGERVRAMYRSKEDAAKAPAGTEVVIADFSKEASLLPALHGVESVYLVCSPIPE